MATQADFRRVTSETLIDFLDWAVQSARDDTKMLVPAHTARLHNLEMRLLTRNDHYAEMVEERLFVGDKAPNRREQISVAVVSPDDSSMPSPPAWGEEIYHPREVEKLLEGSRFRATYFPPLNLWQIYDHQEKFGLQWMMGTKSYPDWEPGSPLRVILHWAYRFAGMRLAHAGTLGKNAEGFILVGAGGSGKSGTVIGGIAHGLDSVGDDYVLIELDENGVHAYPLFKTLKQDRPGLARLGLENTIAATRTTNWQDKFEFECKELSGRSLADHLNIRAIVIPKIANAPTSTIRPIPKNRAMLALAPTGLFQMPGERDSGVRFYSDIVRRVPCFEMALSSDPADVSQTIETFVDGGLQCA